MGKATAPGRRSQGRGSRGLETQNSKRILDSSRPPVHISCYVERYCAFLQEAFSRNAQPEQKTFGAQIAMSRVISETVYDPCPEGTHVARISAIISLGTQTSEIYSNQRKWLFEVEVSSTLRDDGGRFRLSKIMGESLHRKSNMRKAIEGILGRSLTDTEAQGFDIGTLLRKSCFVTVSHKETDNGTRANIDSFVSMPHGAAPAPEFQAKAVNYDFEEDGREIPVAVPEFAQKMIRKAIEWNKAPENDDPVEDDIPFDDDIPSIVEGPQAA